MVPVTAHADDDPPVVGNGGCTGVTSYVTACAAEPGSSGGGTQPASTGSGSGSKGSGEAPKCTTEKIDPQPPADSLGWEGHKPGDGAVYRIWCVDSGRTGLIWAPTAPEAAPIDPEVLARQAVDKMLLAGPDITINPKPGGKGLVGMPVWMSVGQSPTTYGPNTASASAGAVTVTATAQVSSIRWDMGDGTSVTCNGPGTPYQKSFGLKASPDCGHVYKQPSSTQAGGKFKVSATATWAVNWQGGGQTGQLPQVRTSAVELTIVESQAVN